MKGEYDLATLGILFCVTCKEKTCLGKWLRHEDDTGFGFWRGATTYPELGNKTLNFLAKHMDHEVHLLSSGRFEEFLYNRDEEYGDYRHVEDELSATWPEDEVDRG